MTTKIIRTSVLYLGILSAAVFQWHIAPLAVMAQGNCFAPDTPLQFIDRFPVIAEGAVSARQNETIEFAVSGVLKGQVALDGRVLLVSDLTPSSSLQVGERAVLVLDDKMSIVIEGQVFRLGDRSRTIELIRAHIGMQAGQADGLQRHRQSITDLAATFDQLPMLDRVIVLELIGAGHLPQAVPETTVLLRTALRDAEPKVREHALRAARQLGMVESMLSGFVDALEDSSADVRWVGISGLQQFSGERFGYEPFLDPRNQMTAIAQWKRWAQEHQTVKDRDSDGTSKAPR